MSIEVKPVLVLTTSAKLQESLSSILEPEYTCSFAKNLDQAEKIIANSAINVALVDYQAALEGDALDELKELDPNLVQLLVCPRDKRDELITTDLSTKAFRVLFAPLSKGQTKLSIQAAAKYSSTHTNSIKRTSKKSSSKLIPLAALGALAVAGIGYFFLSSPDNDSQLVETNAQTETIRQLTQKEQNAIDDQLLNAKNAIELNNLYPPTENNAVDAYFEVLKVNNQDEKAKLGLENLAQQALGDLELHVNNGSVEEAVNALDNAKNTRELSDNFAPYIDNAITSQKSIFLNNAELALADNRVAESLTSIETIKQVFPEDSDVATVYDTIIAQKANFDRSEELNRLATQAREAMLNNRLLSPSNNNASYFINSLETLDPENSALGLLKSELSSYLLIESRNATLDNNFTQARRLIDSAKRFGANSNRVDSEIRKLTDLQTSFEAVEQRRIQQEQRQREQQLIEQRRAAEQRAAEQRSAEQLSQETQQQSQQENSQPTVAPSTSPVTQQPVINQPTSSIPENTTASQEPEPAPVVQEPAPSVPEPEPEIDLNAPINLRLGALNAIEQNEARYPRRYSRRNLTGSTIVAFRVNKDGTTSNVIAEKITPDDATLFGDSAVRAVENWEFRPHRDENGNLRIVDTKVVIRFQQ